VEQGNPGDRFVEAVADLLTRLGLNGTRLKWRWRNWRTSRTEAAAQRDNRLRSVTGKFKMCSDCRSLVPGGDSACPECGASLTAVRGPGAARFLVNSLPATRSLTAILVTVNVAVYILMGLSAGFATPQGGGISGLFSLFGFDSYTLARFGWGYGPWVIYAGEGWRLFTPIFLHAGLIHLFFNCYVLMQVGKLLEDEFGSPRTWVVYIVSGVCGGLASNFLRPLIMGRDVPYVGASGAVFGLIGLAMIYGWRQGGPHGNAIKRSMLTWTIYVLLFGFVMGADNFAHIGGLLGGVGFGLVINGGPMKASVAALWRAAGVLAIGVCLWAFFMAAIHGPEAIARMR
jgi:rhomboid protease GluP